MVEARAAAEKALRAESAEEALAVSRCLAAQSAPELFQSS